MKKQTVRFHTVDEDIMSGYSVNVWPIDHPSDLVSNDTVARISPVVSVTRFQGRVARFETQNTIYIRAEK